MGEKSIMNKKIKIVSFLLLSKIISLYIYTFLHESGHALIAVICGGRIEEFILGLNAHVRITGASYTKFTSALMNVMGGLLPIIILLIALSLYKSEISHMFYHIFYFVISISTSFSLLAWLIIPIISMFTDPPIGDDVTNFLEISGIHPLMVTLVALLIFLGMIFFIYNKGLIRKAKEIYRLLLQESNPKSRRPYFIFLTIGLLLVFILITEPNIFKTNPVLKTTISLNINQSSRSLEFPFAIEKDRIYNMDFELETTIKFVDLQVFTEKGDLVYQNVISEGSIKGIILDLNKGNHSFVINFLKDTEGMEEHFKIMGYTFDDDHMKMFKEKYSKNDFVVNAPISFSVTIK